jgi:surfactin synthase thioesterase subunit
MYRHWAAALPEIEVYPIEIPGHGTRLGEPLVYQMKDLLDLLLGVMSRLLDKPLVLFGHSLGAHIAYQLAVRLAKIGRGPSFLIVSSAIAPGCDQPARMKGADSDDRLIRWIQEIGGTPSEVTENSDLVDLIIPIIRADLDLMNSIDPHDTQKLNCDIAAFGGIDDRFINDTQLREWKNLTVGRFSLDRFPGGHFYLQPLQNGTRVRLRELLGLGA